MRSINISRRLIIFALTSVLGLLAFGWAHSTPRVIAQGPPVCVTPPPNMVSWWPGDGNANDIQGSNHGTLMNGATFATGKVGQAFSLDGVDDYVTVPNDPSLNPNTMTVMAWYRPTSFAGNGYNAIVQKAYVAHSPPYYQYQLGVSGDQYPYAPGAGFGFGVAAGGVYDGVGTPPGFWSPGRWYHLVGTYDGTAIKLYVDGALVGSRSASGTVPDYGRPLLIGGFANRNSPSIDFTPGMIDEVAIFDRALSASEIQAIYNAGSAGKCKPQCTPPPTGMVSWLPGDGNANDIQGSNHGTLQGGTTFVPGKVGQAFSFNGTDAYVRVLDNANLYPGAGPFTVDAWIKTTQMSAGNAVILAHYECANGCPTGMANSIYYMYVNGDGKLIGFLRDSAGTSQSLTSAKVVADGVYHHIALVRDTAGLQMQLYVDGVVDASAPLTVTGTIKDDDGEADPFTIGAVIEGGTNHPAALFLGEVDEVEYFNRVLTASEIQAIVNADSAGKCKPLMVSVDSKATYLHTTCDSPALPTVVDLAAFGLAPGDGLKLTYSVVPPGFSFSGCGGPFVGAEDTSILGVFSNSSTLLPPSAHPRVPGALEAGTDVSTGPTFFCNELNDIPQDFRLFPPSGFTIQIPAGATHLFLGIADSYWADNCGNIKVTFERIVLNQPPVARCQDVTVSAGLGCQANASIDAGSSDPDGDPLTLTQSPPGPYPVGMTNVMLTVTDGKGGSSTCNATVTVTNDPPLITSVTGPTTPLALGASASVTVNFTDPGSQGHTVTFSWDDGSPNTVVPLAPGVVTGAAVHTYGGAGVYSITVTVADGCGASVTLVYQFIVVYDPSAGFVTGGGWINSPAGAYVANPLLTGKANFGFVSKYQNGASVPTGDTEFQFKAGNLNFKSTVYEWMVIAGARAQYKGSGKINNAGDYRFMLTVIDGQVNGGGGTDKFRIRIWNNAGGGLVYDNQMGASDSADPTTVLGGGSIVIHK